MQPEGCGATQVFSGDFATALIRAVQETHITSVATQEQPCLREGACEKQKYAEVVYLLQQLPGLNVTSLVDQLQKGASTTRMSKIGCRVGIVIVCRRFGGDTTKCYMQLQ